MFSINQESGIIEIKPINRDALQREIFSIQLIAFEVPDPCWTTSQNATIIVNDVNDNDPIITVNTTEISMPENTVTRVNLHINIEDMDQVTKYLIIQTMFHSIHLIFTREKMELTKYSLKITVETIISKHFRLFLIEDITQ